MTTENDFEFYEHKHKYHHHKITLELLSIIRVLFKLGLGFSRCPPLSQDYLS